MKNILLLLIVSLLLTSCSTFCIDNSNKYLVIDNIAMGNFPEKYRYSFKGLTMEYFSDTKYKIGDTLSLDKTPRVYTFMDTTDCVIKTSRRSIDSAQHFLDSLSEKDL